MKANVLVLLLLAQWLPCRLEAVDVRGRVVDVTRSEENPKPVSGVIVALPNLSTEDHTDAEGRFAFPSEVLRGKGAGDTIKLAIRNRGDLIVYAPWLGGERGRTIIPVEGREIVIRLVRAGSKKILSPYGIKELIDSMAGKTVEQSKSTSRPKEVDFDQLYEEISEQVGFRSEELRTAIEDWVNKVMAEEGGSLDDRARAFFVVKDFRKAALLFDRLLAEAEAEAKQKAQDLEFLKKLREESRKRMRVDP